MSFSNNGSLSSCIGILNKSIISNKKSCNISFSKNNLMFLLFLYRNGYLEKIQIINKKKTIKVNLKIYQDKLVLHSIKNYFKVGHKYYLNHKKISELKNQKNIQTSYVLWTTHGFLTLDKAFFRRVGGLLVCKIN